MSPEKYISEGYRLNKLGFETDGCSFIGWLIDDKYSPACWAHDYGRMDLLDLKDQSENDNLFRPALRSLGMSDWLSNLMYYATKSQGFMNDKTGMTTNAFAGMLFFILIALGVFYLS